MEAQILVAVSVGIVLLAVVWWRWGPRQPADDTARAIARLKARPESGAVLTRAQLRFLAAVHEVVGNSEHLGARRGGSQGFHDAVKSMRDQLAPFRQPPPPAGGAPENAGLDRVLDVFPRSRSGSFIHTWVPDPNSLPDISPAEDDGGKEAPATDKQGGGREPVVRSTRAEDGTTKEVTTHYDDSGRVTERQVTVVHPDGRLWASYETRAHGVETRHTQFVTPENVVSSKSAWRREGERQWRAGNPADDVTRMPRDDSGGKQAGRYLLRLRDGSLASCVVLNPMSGTGHCTVLGYKQVNPGPEPVPVIEGARLMVDPYDLVVNPAPEPVPAGAGEPLRRPDSSTPLGSPGVRPGPPAMQ